MINAPNTFIIFDCDRRSYINPNGQLVILANHVLNDHLERIKHPLYNDTDLYICDKSKENVWRVNPTQFHETGYIGFDHSRPAEADRNFIVYVDEKTIRAYLVNQPTKVTEKIIQHALNAIHHPKYTKPDSNKKSVVIDIELEKEGKIPKWFRDARMKQMNDLYDKITAPASNFSIENGPGYIR